MRKPMNLKYPNTKNGRMIRNQLRSIQRLSSALLELLQDDDQVPDWVLSKVTVSLDRLTVAEMYLQAKMAGKLLRPNGKLKDLENWMLDRATSGGQKAGKLLLNYK